MYILYIENYTFSQKNPTTCFFTVSILTHLCNAFIKFPLSFKQLFMREKNERSRVAFKRITANTEIARYLIFTRTLSATSWINKL